ncbi:MAG: type II toxin-antitoxin system MqsA family antitoxin [Balneolaceae bacterium]|nr:type II toxin-antitoxin system MqsA family antitoxin [Balneolaceae bacterium]
MECTICKSGKMKDGEVTVTLQRGNSIIVIKKVPASVCQNCGEYTLSESVTRKIMQSAEHAVANNAEIEVLQYAA